MSREQSAKLPHQADTNTPSTITGSVSLHFILIVPFLLQILAAVSLVGYLSYQNGQRTIEELAGQLLEEISSRIDSQVQAYLDIPQQVQDQNLRSLQAGSTDPTDFERMGQDFWHQVRAFNLQYVYFTTSTGEYVGAGQIDPHKARQEKRWEICTVRRTDPGNYDCVVLDASDRAIATRVYPTGTADIRAQSWYLDTQAARRTLWLEIYNWLDDLEVMGLPLSSPVYDAQGELIGVISLEYGVRQIAQFLQSLAVGKTGQALIIERSGLLVASSIPTPTYKVERGEAQRLLATESPDRRIQALAQFLATEFSSFDAITSPQQLRFVNNGHGEFVQVLPYRDAAGLDWLIVVAIPEADFTAQIAANTRNTIALCVLSLLGAILVGVYTSRWISRPLLRLAQSAGAVARGDWEQQVSGGAIAELQTLAQAFNQMAAQLRTAFSHLEQKVRDRTAQLSATLEQLQKTQAQLIHTEKMSSLGQLVAGVAHEINNPVNFIHGNIDHTRAYTQELLALLDRYSEALPTPPPDLAAQLADTDVEFLRADLAKVLDSMKTGTERIQHIVRSLQGFVRLHEFDLKKVDLHRCLEDTLTILGHRLIDACGHPTVVIVRQYDSLPLVECYPGQLNQVFLQIVTNALDAMAGATLPDVPPVQPTLWLETVVLDGEWVRVRLRDNGPGIPAALRSRIFDAFFTTKEVGQGTGLGLFICHKIVVEQHHGQLSCEPGPDGGTQFTIELPIQQEGESAI